MPTSSPNPLLRRLGRAAAYRLFQLLLVLAYVLRSAGALRLPFHFSHAADDGRRPPVSRRTRPRAPLTARPAL